MRFNLFSSTNNNRNRNFNLVKIDLNQEVKDSNYQPNRGTFIVAIVALSVVASSLVTMGLFSRIFSKKKKHKD